MLARNWKHQWLPLCLARLWRTIRIEGMVKNPIKLNQNLRVFWKLVNLQDCVWENHCRFIMKTILQEKVAIHCSITIWYTNLFLCLKPWKFPQQRQQWTRNAKNWRKFRRGTWQKSKVRNKWSMKQGRRAQKFILHHWWTYVIWKMLNWRQKYKGRFVLRGDIVKDDSGSYAVFIHWTRIISITNDSSKSHGYHLQTAGLRRTSCWRRICLYPGKNGGCTQITENSQIGMSTHLDSSTTTQMA